MARLKPRPFKTRMCPECFDIFQKPADRGMYLASEAGRFRNSVCKSALLVGVTEAQKRGFVEVPSQNLQPDGKFILRHTAGN
jgi:hypothetical protein